MIIFARISLISYIILSTMGTSLYSQICPDWSYTITRQGQVDSFQTLYPQCTEYPNWLKIKGNVYSLAGLSQITKFEGVLDINDTKLTSLYGLHNVNFIGGDLFIQRDSNLVSLEGLNSLTEVDGDVEIIYNPSLQSLAGLNNLSYIHHDLSIAINDTLENLNGLENLYYMQDLGIWRNRNLKNIDGLIGLTTSGECYIGDNDLLLNLDGLKNIEHLANASLFGIEIKNNSSLISIGGFEKISGPISRGVIIENNESLEDLWGLHNITSGSISIKNNDKLVNLLGLNGVKIGGLHLEGNDSLFNLEGLDNLEKATFFSILNNNSLESLSGLESLNLIRYIFVVDGNSKLIDISVLKETNYDLQSFKIRNNSLLSICHIESVCDHLNKSGELISILGNGEGCEDVSAVVNSCDIVNNLDEILDSELFFIYPNPSQAMIYFDITNSGNINRFEIYNSSGQSMISLKDDQREVNISKLKKGLYYVVCKSSNGSSVKTFIKY